MCIRDRPWLVVREPRFVDAILSLAGFHGVQSDVVVTCCAKQYHVRVRPCACFR